MPDWLARALSDFRARRWRPPTRDVAPRLYTRPMVGRVPEDRNRCVARLGIYVDTVYCLESGERGRVWADPIDLAFLLFAREVGRHFGATVLFGRAIHGPPPRDYAALEGIEVAALPHYRDLRHPLDVLRAMRGTARGFLRGLARVDIVWVFGPHPFGLMLVALALARGKRVVLGVRQDTIRYYRNRLPSRWWTPVLIAARALDFVHRLLARGLRTTVVGPDIARSYGAERATVLPMTVSLIRAGDIVTRPASRDWSGTIVLVTVGRIEPEKNPMLMIDVLAHLERASPNRFRLIWVGRGRLADAVMQRAEETGVRERVDLRGFVPFGPELMALYRSAHVFVHVSRTEGVPQVLVEAMACGTPVVATDVGGVGSALDRGRAGLLVPPGDADALVRAIVRLIDDGELRRQLVARGLELASHVTLEAEAARVAAFVAT
jgi:glycosyltransferase involved in cell wall biosynthesis